MQEVSQERYIDIPEEVQDILKLWRPTPLIRAVRLEKALGTPAKIFYKYEGVSPVGSHKPNTAVAQAYYNKIEGINKLYHRDRRRAVGRGPGHGLQLFRYRLQGLHGQGQLPAKALPPLDDAAVRRDGVRQPQRPRPTRGARSWRRTPTDPGSLGMAISEAVEVALKNDDANYSLGSVLNHVLMHQTVIGEETLMQLDKAGEQADVVIGCVGGGSNFGGIALPFVRQNLKEGAKTRLVAVEPMACPSMTKGIYAFDYGDTAKMAPVVKMDTLGHDFVPPGIHAGGLRYHGMSPIVSALHQQRA